MIAALLTLSDPLELNARALEAGLDFAALKRAAADHEAARKDLQLQIRDEYMAAGANKTNAEDQARSDARYIAYLKQGGDLDEQRDRAEVLWKTLHQRAWLLAKDDGSHDF